MFLFVVVIYRQHKTSTESLPNIVCSDPESGNEPLSEGGRYQCLICIGCTQRPTSIQGSCNNFVLCCVRSTLGNTSKFITVGCSYKTAAFNMYSFPFVSSLQLAADLGAAANEF